MNSSAALPPLAKVAAALGKTTETLAYELAAPTSEPPLWTEFEWHIARAATAMQGMSALLHAGLRWGGPESWRRFLLEQWDHSLGRHAQIARLLEAIDSLARREGVAIVALKGAALQAMQIYVAGHRPMGDIDLLVRKDDAKEIARVLQACDYEAGAATPRDQVFQPRVRKASVPHGLGEHIDNPIKLEVHTQIAEPLPLLATDITPFLFPRVAHAGINPYPSAAALMLHLLLHAAGNMRAHALRQIQLHDIALLAQRLGSDDWEELLAMRPDGRPLWWAFAPLTLTARYYPAVLPTAILERLGMECPWWLRAQARRQRLSDVSWSNIRIAAFPGLEWSRTPREAVEFMYSRIWPSREARLDVKEGGAQIPDSATVPWYGISHGARILRWVFSRPPRVQTMLSVRAALMREG
jgi:hypothetical protein